MIRTRIKKSFKLDSEPVLFWPRGPARLVQLKGHELVYSGSGMEYGLQPKRRSSVALITCDLQDAGGFSPGTWRNIFSGPDPGPDSLSPLVDLHRNFSVPAVCTWVSRYGLLGFRPSHGPIAGPLQVLVGILI